MKLVLRRYQPFATKYRKFIPNSYQYYPPNEREKRYITPRTLSRLQIKHEKERQRIADLRQEMGEIEIQDESQQNNDAFQDLIHEGQWPTVAPHLMLDGYQYLEPINRATLAKDKLKSYEQSLDLSIQQTFEPRLHDENYVRKRQAQLFINRMTPLTPAFLRQGANFLSSHLFTKLFSQGKLSILKDFLNHGAFESAKFLHRPFLYKFVPHFIDNPSQQFLLNILSYAPSLLFPNDSQSQFNLYAENETQTADGGMTDEIIFGTALGKILRNTKELNRLRLFWSFQHLYLPQEDHLDHIFEQLNHVSFRVAPEHQAEVNKEVKFILNSAYSSSQFQKLLTLMVFSFKTFHEFIAAYTISVLLLSKLRSIKKLLPESKSNQLHGVFQLIEFNLSKEAQKDLIHMLLSMLSHEDHSRIEYQNFKRSYNYWLKDYTQPIKTQYHSPLSQILQANEQPIQIFYERNASQPAYAKFTHKLSRSKDSPKSKCYFSQSDMIEHILKKDYQPVLDHFITNFHLPVDKSFSKRFQQEINNADRNLSFANDNEAALYKLKKAHNIFFSLSLPQPLSQEYLEPQKLSYNAIVSISDNPIDINEYIQQYKAFNRFQQAVTYLQTQDQKDQRDAQKKDVEAAETEAVETQVQASTQAVAEQTSQYNVPQQAQTVAAQKTTQQQLSAEDLEALSAAQFAANAAEQEQAVQKSNKMMNLSEKQLFEGEVTEGALRKLLFGQTNRGNARRTKQPRLKGIDPDELYLLYFQNKNLNITKKNRKNKKNAFQQQNYNHLYKPYSQMNQKYVSRRKEGYTGKDNSSFMQFQQEEKKLLKQIGAVMRKEEPNQYQQEQYQQPPQQGFFRKKTKKPQGEWQSYKATTEEQLGVRSQLQQNQTGQKFGRKISNFTRKNTSSFCTVTPKSEVEVTTPLFEISRMEEYCRREVDKTFLSILQSEQHVSTSNSGNYVTKYLFLHGKNESAFITRPKRTLNIEFTSVIGTRAKNYERFIKNNLFRYALPEQLYEDLLISQLKRYNRYEFKTIVAHMAYYSESLNDHIVKDLCSICQRERIGYTFVEIAQLIKANDVRLTPEGLKIITQLWQRFEVINQDMLPFLREYTRKMQISLRTDFYASFCRSLIKTKQFDKLQVIATSILQEIRPKPYKLDTSMGALKGDQVAVLQKEWKSREQENYLRLYIELIEVIVRALDNTVPTYIADLFDEYRRMKPAFDEKELGYAFVCYANKRDKVEELLARLDNQPEKGTSFMYDCLIQTLLSNFEALEDLSEKILDVSILKNRVVLTHPQIMKSLLVFKKSSSSNSFSKFLDHCLRFQEDINQSNQIKREMFYILNNNVEDVSVGGIFNLLDFIFNEKRQKERVEYRAIKLSEEEKARKLIEIQQSVTKAAAKPKEDEKSATKKEVKKKGKQQKGETPVEEPKEEEKDAKPEEIKIQGEKLEEVTGSSKKEEKKKLKKEKTNERERQQGLLDQIMAQQQARSLPQTAELRGNNDEQFVSMIKSQTRKHESAKRKNLQSLSTLFQGSMELSKEEQVPKGKGKDEKKVDAKDAKDDKKKKGKK